MLKKTFALLMCAVLLLGILAGCNKAPANNTAATDTETYTAPSGDIFEEYTPAGTLYITFGAAVEIIYDDTGLALQITGTNQVGKVLAEAVQNQLGRGCVFVARALIRYASDNKLIGDARSVALRLGEGDVAPSSDFMSTIATDCQYLADEECTNLRMYVLVDDRLNEDSNLTAAIAKTLAARFLSVEEAALTGGDAIVDGVYTFTAGDKSCTVDAFTGLVAAK